MTDYWECARDFWEYQRTDSRGVKTWEGYDLTVQQFIFEKLITNSELAHLKIEDTDIEIVFDHENGKPRQRDVKTGSECAVRKTTEVIVNDWNVFKKMVDVSKITKLDLCGTMENSILTHKINDDDSDELVKKINNCESLRILDLSRNNLTDAFGVALKTAVAAHTTLVKLDLDENKFGEKTGVALGEALTTNTSLHTLTLYHNKLGENGGAAIIRGLNSNTTLRVLDLNENNLGKNFGVAIQFDLANNTGLHTLYLGLNDLGDEGGAAIIRGLNTNTTLRELELNWNNLSEIFGVAIQDDLANNTGLHTLLLGNNDLGDEGGAAIIRGLNNTLRELHLSWNSLSDNFGVAIQDDLTKNTGLHTLNLNTNNLGEASGAAFVEALTQNSTLAELNIDINPAVSPATVAKIKFALSPELKGLLNDPSVSPSRIPVCVVGFDNVGKTELVNTWHRTTAHVNPHLDPEETAPAKSDDERDKTSGISVKPVKLRLDTIPPSTMLETPTNRQQTEEIPDTVDIIAWDFAGHTQYFLSHELVMRACRGAVFVLLFRIDSLQSNVCHAEQQRLFFWLKFIASMCSNQQQPPTVFIGGSFRPDDDSFDFEVTTEWTDALLRTVKAVFGDVLNIPQLGIYHMDCRKSNDPHVDAMRIALAQTVQEIRSRVDRKVPPICKRATSLLNCSAKKVTAKLLLFEEQLKARRLNPNMRLTPLSWQDMLCGPIMTRANFEAHVLGKLEVKADGMGADEGFVDKLDDRPPSHKTKYPITEIPSIAPKSKPLLQIITTYLHDVGDILWFDMDSLRDTVILTPDLFCSKIIGAIFRPDTRGFNIDAVHRDGSLVRISIIVATFKRALGIDDTHVNAALAILCQLGLCHRHEGNGEESYLFPGALAATSYRRPEWFGPLAPGQHFVVGRRYTLVDPATTIFPPGCMSEIQVWALGRYKGPMIWRDGVIIPFTASQTLAEAGVQLHRPYSSPQDGDKCAQVSMSSITLVVRGRDAAAQPDCLLLLNQLCQKIRETSGIQLVEEALPPNEIAITAAYKNSNMLDVTCPGLAIPSKLDPAIHDIVVGGKLCSMDSLRFGSFVDIPHPVQSIPTPRLWMGNEFEPVCAQTTDGGTHLLVEIPRDHADFTRIKNNMHRSMPNAVICKIQRVQNRALWNKYYLARCDIGKECEDGSPNEIEAWHSTGTTDPWLICSDWKAGFDVNRSGIEMQFGHDNMGRLTRAFRNIGNKSYGTGVYLAEHCIYSDTILPHIRPVTQDKQIILAKVTLGNKYDYGANVPDCRAAIEPEGFHSISGTEGDMKFLIREKSMLVEEGRWSPAWEELAVNGAKYGRQYVVHRSNQVYPAYLVTYK